MLHSTGEGKEAAGQTTDHVACPPVTPMSDLGAAAQRSAAVRDPARCWKEVIQKHWHRNFSSENRTLPSEKPYKNLILGKTGPTPRKRGLNIETKPATLSRASISVLNFKTIFPFNPFQ